MPARQIRKLKSDKPETWVEVGTLDSLETKIGTIAFKGKPPIFAVSPDGRRIVFLNAPAVPGVALGERVKAICYTTRRLGKLLHYRHAFREDCAPRLEQRGSRLAFVGGRFKFLDTGINDMPRSF